MSHYRRSLVEGGSYFFTVVSYRRQAILCDEKIRKSLRDAIGLTRMKYPFAVDAWVLLPDHIHCIWTLPAGDSDFSTRWSSIKRHVSLACGEHYKREDWMPSSRKKHRESTLWQRRFWEHQIRNQEDFNRHVEYIHYNPVKHGLCERVSQWPYSTFHRFVDAGVYPEDWAGDGIDSAGGYGE